MIRTFKKFQKPLIPVYKEETEKLICWVSVFCSGQFFAITKHSI